MDLNFRPELFEKKIDPETGNILFFRRDMRGISEQVIEGDGFTVEFKDDQVYLVDIFNAKKVMRNLLKTIPAEELV